MTKQELILLWREYELVFKERIDTRGGRMSAFPSFEGFINWLETGEIEL